MALHFAQNSHIKPATKTLSQDGHPHLLHCLANSNLVTVTHPNFKQFIRICS
jgi:hypothetical protein